MTELQVSSDSVEEFQPHHYNIKHPCGCQMNFGKTKITGVELCDSHYALTYGKEEPVTFEPQEIEQALKNIAKAKGWKTVASTISRHDNLFILEFRMKRKPTKEVKKE